MCGNRVDQFGQQEQELGTAADVERQEYGANVGKQEQGPCGQLEWGQCGTTGTRLYVEPQEQGQRGQHK